jgi:WD40 repeat protein
MLRNLVSKVLLLPVLAAVPVSVRAQECAPPSLTPVKNSSNIFSPEQEMVLGELTYQRLAREMHFMRDPELVAYINRIGEKLIKHLPPTGLKFQFFIIDIPEANAFDVPGGYIFVSRKLIGFANNEDELAGVLAHELGHALVHHGAIDFSQLLKKILNVTQLGDRKDIIEKYNLLIERQRTKNISRKSEDVEQLEADRIGVFAMIAAGYDPLAFASFFDRLAETKGKTGNWFTDIFGKAKPEQKRLREMIKITEQIPARCRETRSASASQDFLKWQADVVSQRESGGKEELTALLWKKELSPKLRSDISHFAFSPDGKYFLAQDDFAITVIQREPLEVAFQIPAREAHEGSFTPDGQFVTFGTENLRHEKWSVAEKKPVQVRELVVRRDCWEHGFSPDGNYLVCFDLGLNLNVIDTRTGKRVWEKKEFYRLTFFELFSWLTSANEDRGGSRDRFFHIEFSPDSRYVAVARTNQSRISFKSSWASVESEDTLLGLDLNTLKPLNTGGELKSVTKRPFVFLDSSRILGMASSKLNESGTFSFPEGKRLAKFDLAATELKSTSNSKYVIVKPMATAQLGVFDVSKGAIVGVWNKADTTLWDNLILFESTSGEVAVSEVRYDEEKKTLIHKKVGTIEIPVASIGKLYAADVSDNLQWLALSSKTRGAFWNLSSGERKMYVRGFRGSVLANSGAGVSDFPKLAPLNRSLVLIDPGSNATEVLHELPEKGAKQYGRFVLIRQSLKEPKKSEEGKSNPGIPGSDANVNDRSLSREVRFELRNFVDSKVVWSREFLKEAPRFFFDEFSGRLILYWTLGSEVGKARLKEDAAVAARAKELGNKDDDYLMEIVDAFTGKTIGTMLLETGKGSFDIEFGFSEGNWLVLRDTNNRILAYSVKDGELRHRFFGAFAAVNPVKNQIVVENHPGELTFYDLDTGDSQARLNFGNRTVFIRYTLDGKKLFVLSGEQTAYAFEVDRLAAVAPQRAN